VRVTSDAQQPGCWSQAIGYGGRWAAKIEIARHSSLATVFMDESLPTILELHVVTPERMIVREQASSVSLPGKGGRLGVLPGHAPLISELANGVLFYEHSGQTNYVAVLGGFTEVLPGQVTVLAPAAEPAEAIDVNRAERAKEKAEEVLRQASSAEAQSGEAQAALERAVARIEAARHKAQ
jgi:F-type H+-transporting ATPase subunit epsilon